MIGLGVALIHALIWGGLFALSGISLLAYGRTLDRKPAPPPGWLPAKAKVLDVAIARTPRPGMGMAGFAPVIGYSYKVNGYEYRSGETVTGPHLGADSVSANKLAARYPVGSDVMVHYNPHNPREVAAEVDAKRGRFFITAGIALLVLAVVISCSTLGFGPFVEDLVRSAVPQ